MEKKEFTVTDVDAIESTTICTNCKKLLNVNPIFCYKDENDDLVKEVCGRCVHVLKNINGKTWRQHSFENLAQYLTYPCSNKKFGCNVVLGWEEVLDHEIVCTYQSMACPLSCSDLLESDNCNWVGNVKKVNEHIETTHKDLMVNPPQYDFVEPYSSSIFFTHVGTQLITIVIKYEGNDKFYCLVMLNGNDIESQCYRYQLELLDATKENSLILRRSRLEPLGCMSDNLKNLDKMVEIDVNRVRDMLKQPGNILGRFGIVKKNKKEISQISGIAKHPEVLNTQSNTTVKTEKVVPPDETMLQELECPVCNGYMIPPIYICQTGHSICNECKVKVTICPNCRCNFSGARNFTLEKLTLKVYYPCRNREIGCAFVTSSDKIRSHETSCELSETNCILKCGHKCLRPSMYSHVLERHCNATIEVDTIYHRDVTDKKETFLILYFGGELFRFSIKGNGLNPYKFNLQHLGMLEGEPTYRYQLQILDPSPQGQSLSITYVCQCLTEAPHKAHSTAITVPWEMIKPFIFDTKYFNYKITISKI